MEARKKKVPFTRTARITGYLVGDIKRWNPGKKQELADRVSHLSVKKEEKAA